MKRAKPERWDLVVVGGGPAGSTLATVVKLHAPEKRVLLLEKETFPRHHIGESLLPGMVHVLEEMGVVEKIKEAGFPKKFGVVFVWGEDRKPWDADFIKFSDEMLQKYGETLGRETSWQVTRGPYDALLLDHARSVGVETRVASAARPIEERGRVAGVVLEDGSELRADVVADCSGQNGFMSRHRDVRRPRPSLKNVAAYAYFKGAKWKYEYTSHPDKTKIFVCSVPEGWFWYIPLSRTLVSVGLVSKSSLVKERGGEDYRDFFFGALKRCEEIWPLLEQAELVKGEDPKRPEKDFFTASDWSYTSETASGPGWLAAGDAAFFIDPLLSSGVTLAHLSAHRAAYTVLTAWKEGDAGLEKLLWKDYDRFCKETAGSFLSLVEFWYSKHPNPAMWLKQAKRSLVSRAPLDLSDQSAFVAVIAGVDSLYERVYADRPWAVGTNTRSEAAWTLGGTGTVPSFAPDAVPRWRVPYEKRVTFLPVSGTGLLRPIHSLRFKDPSVDALDAFAHPRSRTLPLSYLAVAEAVDGKRPVAAIKEALRAKRSLPRDVVDIQVDRLLADLSALGVLEVSAPKAAKAKRAAAPAPGPVAKGEDLLSAGRAAEAEKALAKASGPWAAALRGEARRRLGRVDEALADYAAALAPGKPAKAGKRVDALLAAFDESVRRGWLADRVLAWRARVRLERGDAAGAKADADAALKLNAGQFDALKVRAEASRALGDSAASLKDLESLKTMLAGRPTPPGA